MRPFLSWVVLGSTLRTSSAQAVGGQNNDYCIEWLQQGGGHIDATTPSVRLVDPFTGENVRGMEEPRRCDESKILVGCLVAESTGQVYATDPDVCASATTAQFSEDRCKVQIATYGYTSDDTSSGQFTTHPAGWYDIKCPILKYDCAAETEIYCPSSSTCIADCNSCTDYSWEPPGGVLAEYDVCTNDAPEPEPEQQPPRPPPPSTDSSTSILGVVLAVVFILMLGMGAVGWRLYTRVLLAGGVGVVKAAEKEPLAIEVQMATPAATATASALAPSAPPAGSMAVHIHGQQVQMSGGGQEPEEEPQAKPKSEPEPEPQNLTPKQRRELAKEEAKRRWEKQEAEERRQLMQMLSEKFAFAQMNSGETEAEMVGRARCDSPSSRLFVWQHLTAVLITNMTQLLFRVCSIRLGHSEIFDSVDLDRGGTISAEELSEALSNRSSGEKLEGRNLEMVMKQLDTDGESCLGQFAFSSFASVLDASCDERSGIELVSA